MQTDSALFRHYDDGELTANGHRVFKSPRAQIFCSFAEKAMFICGATVDVLRSTGERSTDFGFDQLCAHYAVVLQRCGLPEACSNVGASCRPSQNRFAFLDNWRVSRIAKFRLTGNTVTHDDRLLQYAAGMRIAGLN